MPKKGSSGSMAVLQAKFVPVPEPDPEVSHDGADLEAASAVETKEEPTKSVGVQTNPTPVSLPASLAGALSPGPYVVWRIRGAAAQCPAIHCGREARQCIKWQRIKTFIPGGCYRYLRGHVGRETSVLLLCVPSSTSSRRCRGGDGHLSRGGASVIHRDGPRWIALADVPSRSASYQCPGCSSRSRSHRGQQCHLDYSPLFQSGWVRGLV